MDERAHGARGAPAGGRGAARGRWPSRLSQIDVRDARDAVVLLDGDTVMLRLGDRDFAARLQDYLDVATALEDRVTAIDYGGLAVR